MNYDYTLIRCKAQSFQAGAHACAISSSGPPGEWRTVVYFKLPGTEDQLGRSRVPGRYLQIIPDLGPGSFVPQHTKIQMKWNKILPCTRRFFTIFFFSLSGNLCDDGRPPNHES